MANRREHVIAEHGSPMRFSYGSWCYDSAHEMDPDHITVNRQAVCGAGIHPLEFEYLWNTVYDPITRYSVDDFSFNIDVVVATAGIPPANAHYGAATLQSPITTYTDVRYGASSPWTYPDVGRLYLTPSIAGQGDLADYADSFASGGWMARRGTWQFDYTIDVQNSSIGSAYIGMASYSTVAYFSAAAPTYGNVGSFQPSTPLHSLSSGENTFSDVIFLPFHGSWVPRLHLDSFGSLSGLSVGDPIFSVELTAARLD